MNDHRRSEPRAEALFNEASEQWEQAVAAQDDPEEQETAEDLFQRVVEGLAAALVLGLEEDDAILAYTLRGYAHFQLERFPQALEDLNRALEMDPEFATAIWYRGLLHQYGLEDLAKAVEDYDRAAALYEEEPDLCDLEDPTALYMDRAQALREQERWSEAVHSARRALELEPRNPEALYLLGSLEVGAADLASAARHLQQALRLEPALRPEAQEDPNLEPLRREGELWAQVTSPRRRSRRREAQS